MWYAAQGIPPIDAEIAKKGHFWMETNYIPVFRVVSLSGAAAAAIPLYAK